MVRSSSVAEEMGGAPRSVGKTREALIDLGVVAVPQYGSLMFSIPLLRQFLRKERSSQRNIMRALDWGV